MNTFGIDEMGGYSQGIKEYHYNGDVYDLTIDEDNSFVADGMLVHNCVDSLSFAVQVSQVQDDATQINWEAVPDMVVAKDTVKSVDYDYTFIKV